VNKRIARLNEQLRRELSELIRVEVRDPRVGLVTITGVDTARDLGSSKIYVRVVGDEAELATTLEGLEAAAPFLRTSLGRFLRVRRIPELRFREDRSFAHARRIEQVLAEVIPPDDPDADASTDEVDDSPEGGAEPVEGVPEPETDG
jgi:ribosome-binding factor A